MSDAPTCELCGAAMAAERLGGKAVGWHCAACKAQQTDAVMRRISGSASKAATRIPKLKSPWCERCGKRVEGSTVTPDPRRAGTAVVEYRCHGESARQEMPTSLLAGGLAAYTAFNEYSSGLMLGAAVQAADSKKGGKRRASSEYRARTAGASSLKPPGEGGEALAGRGSRLKPLCDGLRTKGAGAKFGAEKKAG
jgi:ribosomal protein L37AE/L43A